MELTRPRQNLWRLPRWRLGVSAITLAPLVVLLVVVLVTPWVPVLDMAMTELRVRDVGTRHTTLIGLPGRIGIFPDQGSHAGPLYFYLVAPLYRLAGTQARGLEFAMVVINIGCVAGSLWLGARRWGNRGMLMVGLTCAFLIRYYATVILGQPWNPYFPVLVWGLSVLGAIAVLSGAPRVTPLVIAGASLCAQTHVSYLVPAASLCVLVLGYLAYRRRTRALVIGGLVGCLLWLPPLIEELVQRPGNLTAMVRHFTGTQTEPAIGLWDAVRILTRHLDVIGAFVAAFTESAPALERSTDPVDFSIVGLMVIVVWIGSGWWVVRERRRDMYPLYAVTALLIMVDWFSLSRIFGRVWYYLSLFVPVTAVAVWVCIGWVAALWIRRRFPNVALRTTSWPATMSVVLVGALSIGSMVDVATYQVPEASQGAPIGALLPDLLRRLEIDERSGDERYLILSREAHFAPSLGLGLLNELDRRGYHVGMEPPFRVPATAHRVLTAQQATVELHLVSGVWIERSRSRPGFVLLAEADTRTPPERDRYEELGARVEQRLSEIGRDDLVPLVADSVFFLSLDDELPDDIVSDLAEMLEIGVPVAVFSAPLGSG